MEFSTSLNTFFLIRAQRKDKMIEPPIGIYCTKDNLHSHLALLHSQCENQLIIPKQQQSLRPPALPPNMNLQTQIRNYVNVIRYFNFSWSKSLNDWSEIICHISIKWLMKVDLRTSLWVLFESLSSCSQDWRSVRQ